ncbi:hypothetical protein BCR32DRAFT_234868 [Anaeromyces robustus]|uniref:ER membrane protein complex subunit 6 n=1 Tax=Anaeromyces robustus TaxID=1754192 RepID=A0A1Y1WZA6_9FUNG|nr:hypothetical protein BCR32DRAFT_234868 [Anaeromyces robustus]|eukprot:ORX78678.1 hypothetical protein BCR32DRAFT_234868 [Anaeromyces robustus]
MESSIPSKFEKLNVVSMMENNQTAQAIRILASLFGGFAAGIMGLTGWSGIIFYGILSVVIFFFILLKAKFQYTKYFNGIKDVLVGDLFSNFLCYVMFWTLGYALVHVYE